MKIAICDDEIVQQEYLRTLVEEYLAEQSCKAAIECFQSADALLMSYDLHPDFDILLLDIQMQGTNGMELAKRLRAQNKQLAIIFVTGVMEYIYDGFNVQAINYLLKPIQKEQLFACLKKAMAIVHEQRREVLLLQVNKEVLRIPFANIYRVESEGHYLRMITAQQPYRIKKTLKQLQEELPPYFYKIGKSDVVNLDAIAHITSKEIRLINQDVIPIPKGKYRMISEAFIQRHFAGGDAL